MQVEESQGALVSWLTSAFQRMISRLVKPARITNKRATWFCRMSASWSRKRFMDSKRPSVSVVVGIATNKGLLVLCRHSDGDKAVARKLSNFGTTA